MPSRPPSGQIVSPTRAEIIRSLGPCFPYENRDGRWEGRESYLVAVEAAAAATTPALNRGSCEIAAASTPSSSYGNDFQMRVAPTAKRSHVEVVATGVNVPNVQFVQTSM